MIVSQITQLVTTPKTTTKHNKKDNDAVFLLLAISISSIHK